MRLKVRRLMVVLHDLFVTLLAWLLAWIVRFNLTDEIPTDHLITVCIVSTPFAVAVQTVISTSFGLYRGVWRFASLPDLFNIVRTAFVGVLCITLGLFFIARLDDVPRTVLILYPFFLIFFLGGPRLAYRMWKDHSLSLSRITSGERVLVIGGGRGAEALIREMLRERRYLPVGILAAGEESMRHARIHGVPILGIVEDIPRIAEKLGADVLVIAVDEVSGERMQRIVTLCEATGRKVRTIPTVQDLVTHGDPLKALREVSIDDLLGRESIRLDWAGIAHRLAGRRILVTGAGGSIGSELCRQIMRLGPRTVVLFEKGEFALYEIERSLRRAFPNVEIQPILGDVCDEVAVDQLFARHTPQICFHAAAYKHVHMVERQIREGVRNNLLGTFIVATQAAKHRCEKFILISTDKAVAPSSVMGSTKRAAEICCEVMNKGGGTQFITVRFGNVLGSSGSVVPLFREQIANGGPVTVTHPEITRYFMTIPEACQWILQAAAMGQGGEIFVLDMGQPMKIAYLAEQMIRLSGKELGRDIQIEYIGMRPGEKLFEELFYDAERMDRTAHEKIWLAHHAPLDRTRAFGLLEEMRESVACYDEGALARQLAAFLQTGEGPGSRKVVRLDVGRTGIG
jgi:FlaA1/EpsC-like NDP-sugar epimerase